MKKFIILMSIMMLILIIFSSCEEEEATGEISVSEDQGMTIIEKVGMNNVFSTTQITLQKGCSFTHIDFNDRYFIIDTRIYFAAEYMDKENPDPDAFFSYLQSYDLDGENEEMILITPINEGAYVRFLWCDSNLNRIIIEELDYKYILSKYSSSGKVLFSVELSDIIKNKTILSMGIGDEDDNIYIACSDLITVFSNDGKMVWQIAPDDTVLQIVTAHGKTPILRLCGYGNMIKYQYINTETRSITDIEIPQQMYAYMQSYIAYGEGDDYYHVNKDGVYGYEIASNTLTKIMDWTNSNLMFSQMKMLAIITPEIMLMAELDSTDYMNKLYILNHVPDYEIPIKTYISIGYVTLLDDAYLTQAVSDFNKNNDEYRITLTNFYPREGGLDPLLRLNNEIASGNAPDILYINSSLSPLMYAKNGLFVDLYEYLDKDPELRENLLSFVTESVELNGILPQMITKFKIRTLIGKTENLDGKTSWSMSDMLMKYKSLLNNTIFSYDISRNWLKTYVLDGLIAECLDYDNAVCDFNKQGFKDYIELYKLLTENFDSTEYVNDYMQFKINNFGRCRNNEMLLSSSTISNVYTYMDEIILNFRDEEVSIIGYPTMFGDASGDYIEANGFSILSTSENKDAAWEFIKFTLSDYFTSRCTSLFEIIPTKRAIDIINDWYEGQYIYYADNNIERVGSSFLIKDAETKYGPGIQEQINDEWITKFNTYLDTINNYVYKDINVINIVDDEVSVYVNSNKSTDDTIKAIQSRVLIYMSETWG